MSKKEEKKNKKRKGHPVRNFCIILIILAILGGGGMWRFGGYEWGYQGEGKDETTTSAEKVTSADATTAEETVEKTTEKNTETDTETVNESVIIIEVEGEAIKVGEKSFTKADDVKKQVLSLYSDKKTIELIDNKALKSAYDTAKSILDELGYSYKESTK